MIDIPYSLVIEATEDPEFFGFYSPDLEGFTGVGQSVEDCLYQAKWGMKEHVALLSEKGLSVPEKNPDPKIVVQNAKELDVNMNIVYVLTNPAMPELVKIGQTAQEDANLRIGQLYTTGVPVPFQLEFACRVEDAEVVEEALHVAFAPNRVNPRREFFRIEPEQAIAILKLLHVEDATVEVAQQPTDLDQQSLVAAEQLRAGRPSYNFEEMGIPMGSVLQFTRGVTTAKVIGPRKVTLGDEEMSLTAATQQLLGVGYSVRTGRLWTFNGRSLYDIYVETYGAAE